MFLDDNKALYKRFGFNKERSPLNIRPDDLQKVLKEFRKQFPQSTETDKQSIEKDFLYTNIDKKNAINNLSEEYYQYIKENSEKYFYRLEEFLKNPRNTKYRKLYHDTVVDFKGVIISRRGDYDKFDKILEDVFSEAYDNLKEHNIDKTLLRTLIHFMYFTCDIGKKKKGRINLCYHQKNI